MEVVFAENGREGIERLKITPGVDVMLIDIMMPEMDGYETMSEIREAPAIQGSSPRRRDRKSHERRPGEVPEAGATDYVSKPVDIDQLLAVLRVQLGRSTYVAKEADVLTNGAAEDEMRP